MAAELTHHGVPVSMDDIERLAREMDKDDTMEWQANSWREFITEARAAMLAVDMLGLEHPRLLTGPDGEYCEVTP